ncbi:MAG: hypothetical protein KAS70_08690, partial [Planctomycetes bacterium]|nr:hypothetical protein [Planctomycetota bacterium]
QKHIKKSSVHFDLMVHRRQVLKTWSLRSCSPGAFCLLARRLNDHRLVYLTYQGKISRGRGTVRIWDRGTYQVKEWSRNILRLKLSGRKMKGEYCLIRPDLKKPDRWWLIKLSG